MPKGSGRGKMPADLLAKYDEAFDAIDSDGQGSISKAELTFILGDGIPEEAIDACLAKFDTDKDGSMEKEEYFDFVYGSMLESARALLKAADTSGDGKLTKEELSACFEQMGFPPEMAVEAMTECDDDGSGTLSIDELVDYLLEV